MASLAPAPQHSVGSSERAFRSTLTIDEPKHLQSQISRGGWHLLDGLTPTTLESFSTAVSHVHGEGDTLVATSGTRVQIYSGLAHKTDRDALTRVRVLQKFGEGGAAHSARVRRDETLVAVGTDSGQVRVFDAQSRSVLRTFRGHTATTRVVRWGPADRCPGLILSGSNDSTARVWDLAAEVEVAQLRGHKDDVRGACFVGCGSEMMWCTGSYDGYVRIWDTRASFSAPISSIHLDKPVECVLGHQPFGLAAAGGDTIAAFDVRKLDAPTSSSSQHHQKTITCVVPSATGEFLLTGSLDGSVKALFAKDVTRVDHCLKFRGAVLTLQTSPSDDWRLFAGTAEGELVGRTRKGLSGVYDAVSAQTPSLPVRAGTTRHFLRGRASRPGEEQQVVTTSEEDRPLKRLRPHDVCLKSFKYKEALDAVLATREPAAVAGVLEELIQRGDNAMDVALQGREETELEPLLSFCTRFVAHPRFSRALTPVCEKLLSKIELGESVVLDGLIGKLDSVVRLEVQLQKKLLETLGATAGALQAGATR